VTALGNINAGGRILAADVRSVAPLAVIKGADESVLNSATLQFDDALFLAVPANTQWLFKCVLNYEGGTHGASDIRWTWNVPTGATLRYYTSHLTNTNPVIAMLAGSATGSADTNGAGNLNGILMDGSLIVGSTAGNISLEWAQFTASNVTPTIVHAQSYLSLWQTA
jgi:hypothetical protein